MNSLAIKWVTIPASIPSEETISLAIAGKQGSKYDLKIGPVYFKGKAPFNTQVKVITCLASAENGSESQKKEFITYVGYKKENDSEFDFDEMIPSKTWEDAQKTHEKTCDFFNHSSLFIQLA
jgi:hypothetical protein